MSGRRGGGEGLVGTAGGEGEDSESKGKSLGRDLIISFDRSIAHVHPHLFPVSTDTRSMNHQKCILSLVGCLHTREKHVSLTIREAWVQK